MKIDYFKEQYENAPLPYHSLDVEGNILIVNPAWCEILGYDKEEVINNKYSDFLTPESVITLKNNFPNLCKNGIIHGVEFDLIHKNGSIVSVVLDGKVAYTSSGEFKQTHCIFKPVERFKKHEMTLSNNTFLYFNKSNACVYVYDPESLEIIDANKKMCDLYDYTYKEITAMKLTDLNPNTFENIRKNVDLILRGNVDYFEVNHIDKKGNVHYIETHPSVINISDKDYILSIFHDITERKENEFLLNVISQIHNTFLEEDADLLFANLLEIFLKYFDSEFGLVGYLDKEDNLIAPSMTYTIFDQCRVENKSIVFSKSSRKGILKDSIENKTIYIKSENFKFPSGHIELANAMSVPIVKSNKVIGAIVLGNKNSGYTDADKKSSEKIAKLMSPVLSNWLSNLFHKEELKEINLNLAERIEEEISIRKKNEQLLFEQKKFADMGQMISAIAHQWRQPLNNMQLVSQMRKEIHSGENYDISYDELFQNNTELIEHMSSTIDDFRNFFSPNKEITDFSIVQQMLNTLELINPQYNNNGIQVSIKCQCENGSIKCGNMFSESYCAQDKDLISGFPSEIKQVFLNILSNASDATLEAFKNNNGLDKIIDICVVVTDDAVSIDIHNNGNNIPVDVIGRIFEPYFTTKDEGKGTGIGLYMSKMIIENSMNGRLTCNNTENGVNFNIKIPIQ